MQKTIIKSEQVSHVYDVVTNEFGVFMVKVVLKNRSIFPPDAKSYLSIDYLDEELQKKAKDFFKNKRKV